jgi:hypothetical protein
VTHRLEHAYYSTMRRPPPRAAEQKPISPCLQQAKVPYPGPGHQPRVPTVTSPPPSAARSWKW